MTSDNNNNTPDVVCYIKLCKLIETLTARVNKCLANVEEVLELLRDDETEEYIEDDSDEEPPRKLPLGK